MRKKTLLLTLLIGSFSLSCKSTKEKACIDPARINTERACTMQYDPVCGCDNVTYGNACIAETKGVTSFTKGACAAAKESAQ